MEKTITMDTLPHTRVSQHLSRFSLSAHGLSLLDEDANRKFYLILPFAGFQKQTLITLADAFGCNGLIVYGMNTEPGLDERKDDDETDIFQNQRPVHFVKTMDEARTLAKQVLGCDIVGVTSQPFNSTSISVSHPKAFTRSVAFAFFENGTTDSVFTNELCDQWIHIFPHMCTGPSTKNCLTLEAMASITLFRFTEAQQIPQQDRTSPTSFKRKDQRTSSRQSTPQTANGSLKAYTSTHDHIGATVAFTDKDTASTSQRVF